MKKNFTFKQTAIVTALALAMACPSMIKADEVFKVMPSSVYQVVKNIPLKQALMQISQRSGIVFKINTDLSKDVLNKNLSANSWSDAIKSLLTDYNYTMINDQGAIKTVLITGKRGMGIAATQVTATSDPPEYKELVVIESVLKPLPEKYQGMPAGAATVIVLPVKKLMELDLNKTINLDLPMGQFNVMHDSTTTGADGSKIFVGHLADEGLGYRMILSQGNAGVMGHVITPGGTFNIEQTANDLILIDTSKLSEPVLTLDPNPDVALANEASTANSLTTIDQLTATVADKKTILDAANAALAIIVGKQTLAVSNLAIADANYAAKLSVYNQATLDSTAAWNAMIAAQNLLGKKGGQAIFDAAYLTYTNSITALNTATTNKEIAGAARLPLQTALSLANAEVIAAKTPVFVAQEQYDNAVKALNVALAQEAAGPVLVKPPTGPVVSGSPIVDLMVVYTTQHVSANFTKQRIAYLVTASNQAYSDSGIKFRLRLVHTKPTTYSDTTHSGTALNSLASNVNEFAGVNAARITYGADLVMLFRPLYAQAQQVCGVSYLGMANGQAARANIGYSVVSDGSSLDQYKSYYCGINTFAHELGHNFGLVHERENTKGVRGAYPYSYAWGIQGKFGTIMGYKKPMVMYFSTPLKFKCAGLVCGYAETDTQNRSSDQVKSINLTAPVVVNFMPTMTTVPVLN